MKIEYYVNLEKRTVVCRISNCHDVLTEQLEKRGYFIPYNDTHLEIADEYVGKAVCSPDDKFDEKFGMILAYRRATIKMNADVISMAKMEIANLTRGYNSYVNDFQSIITKAQSASAAKKEAINKLLHPESN